MIDRQTSNISHILVGSEIVDHSDVVGACRLCTIYIFILDLTPRRVFHLPSSLNKLSKLRDANFTFNYPKLIHILFQCFDNLLMQRT